MHGIAELRAKLLPCGFWLSFLASNFLHFLSYAPYLPLWRHSSTLSQYTESPSI